jgi:hypothetical protein
MVAVPAPKFERFAHCGKAKSHISSNIQTPSLQDFHSRRISDGQVYNG